MEIFVIRHGQSIGNTKKGFIAGRKDPEGLTQLGKNQIIRSAWELRDENITQIISSPVVRAQESAKILSSSLGVPIKTMDFLYELNQGIFENHYWWEVVPKDFIPDKKIMPFYNFDIPYQDGESFKMLTQRVYEGLQELRKIKNHQKILLVTHDAVISTLTYLIEHNIDLSKQEINGKEFLKYIHKTRVANGSFVKIILKNNQFQVLEKSAPESTVGITEKSVAFYISGLFQLQQPLKVTSFETASGHKVYLIKNKNSHLVKLLTQKEGKEDLHLLELYKYLHNKTKIPAPTIEYYDDYHIFFDKSLLVLDYTEGENMEMCLKTHPKELLIIQEELYKTISQLHSLKLEEVKKFWYTSGIQETTLTNWKTFIKQAISNSLEGLTNISLEADVKTKITQSLMSLKKYVSGRSYQIVPLHGDLSSENIIISHQQKTCHLAKILDFERTRVGDPLWDLVYYYGWIERINPEVAEEWKTVFWKKLSPTQQQTFLQFRILFHLWTVRDMHDYQNNPIREKRGLKSLEILKNISV